MGPEGRVAVCVCVCVLWLANVGLRVAGACVCVPDSAVSIGSQCIQSVSVQLIVLFAKLEKL